MNDWKLAHEPYTPSHLRAYPDQDRPVWLMREEWDAPVLRMWNDLSPLMNVVGLYWASSEDGMGPPALPLKETETP